MTQLNLINLKNIFLYEIGLIAIREVSPPFDEEQEYWRPYQPKHSPSYDFECSVHVSDGFPKKSIKKHFFTVDFYTH